MIVKHHAKGWEIISQYAHGLLSGKIASQLKKEMISEHWVDVLTGIIEHDDHLMDFDEQSYVTESGTPKDFMMEQGTDQDSLEHAKRVFSNAMQKSQLVALMVGRHLEFLYENLAKEYGPMKEFLEYVAKLRKKQRKLYSLRKKNENDLYDIMLFCDRCSLILCQDEVPETGRKLEINHTIDDKTYYIMKTDRDAMKIEPWPFQKEIFSLDFEYRHIDKITFKNNAELEQAIHDAPVKMRSIAMNK